MIKIKEKDTKIKFAKVVSMLFLKLGSILVLFTITGCIKKEHQLTIAAASSLQFVVSDIVSEYQETSGVKVHLVTGSSGKLYNQIANGAPYDVFLSADTLFPSQLGIEGIGSPNWEVFAYGTLVMWSSDTVKSTVSNFLMNFTDTSESYPLRWAIANPEIAPYGKASKQYLRKMGLLEFMQKNMVRGESVSQVNQFVHSKSVFFGFTSYSSVLAKEIDSSFWKVIPRSEYEPIQQTSILLKESDKANKFLDFLKGKKASKQLKSYGYVLPNS